jgi:hypothetical protein
MVMHTRSGRSVGDAVQRALAGVQGEVNRQAAAMTQLEQATGDLVERRGQALLDLAKHYLPAIDHPTIMGTFTEVRGQLLEVLNRKQRHEEELQKTLADDAAAASQLEDKLEAVTAKLNEQVKRREELEKEVAGLLEKDAEFQRLSKEALAAEQELNRNEQRVAQIQAEADQKLPSYEQSRLFQYLHQRGYGTPTYKKEGLTRRLDRWVAGLINYPRARRSYDFLRVTPELVANEVSHRRDQFNGLMEQVEAIEDRNADQVGLTEVMREGLRLGSQRDELVNSLASQQSLTEKHQAELAALGGARNAYYDQALARMKQFLGNLDDWRLQHASQSTPEPEDDRLVGEIVWLGGELEKNKQQVGEIAYQQNAFKERAGGLQELWNHFRRAEFDSQRSLFRGDFPVEEYLERFVQGHASWNEVWSAISSAQQFAPPWYDEPPGDLRRAADSDFSYVLMRVLTDIAGQALRNAAYRGMERRGPIRQQQRIETGRPQFRNRGFTSGKGF